MRGGSLIVACVFGGVTRNETYNVKRQRSGYIPGDLASSEKKTGVLRVVANLPMVHLVVAIAVAPEAFRLYMPVRPFPLIS